MLPIIDMPTYEIEIPSSKEKITVRPFNVKEEKLLLMAMESKDVNEIIKTVKQIISNCIIKGTVNIDKLPFFDVDYLFIFLRAKSIGETIEVNLTCNNILESGDKCGNVFPTSMNISNCEIVYPDEISNDIKLNEKQGVKMRYPSYAAIKRIEFGDEIDVKTNTIAGSIDHIYDAKGVYSYKDYSKEELKEFVEGLTEENYKKMMGFIDNFPTFVVKMEATCNKCGFQHKVRYSDFYDFFI